MIFRAFKKTLAVCLIGLGLGILLVLLLPICRLAISYRSSGCICWNNVAFMLMKGEWRTLKIVVKKVPRCLRGFVKLIFGIRD